jgi:hypothetical protein
LLIHRLLNVFVILNSLADERFKMLLHDWLLRGIFMLEPLWSLTTSRWGNCA